MQAVISPRRVTQFKSNDIRVEKRRLFESLKAVEAKYGRERLIPYLLEEINRIADDLSYPNILQCLIMIISTLQLYKKSPVLAKDMEIISRLEMHAHNILRFANIKPKSSKFSFFYTDIYQTMSSIYFNQGLAKKSAVEHCLGLYHAGENSSGGNGFQALAIGIRQLRLGNGRDALESFEQASLSGTLGGTSSVLLLSKNKIKNMQITN